MHINEFQWAVRDVPGGYGNITGSCAQWQDHTQHPIISRMSLQPQSIQSEERGVMLHCLVPTDEVLRNTGLLHWAHFDQKVYS